MKHICLSLISIVAFGETAQADRLVIKGSDTLGAKLVPQLAEQFKAQHPGTTFDIAAEGSTTGIAAIIDGTAQIGMSSRRAKPAELVDACWTKDAMPQKVVEKQQYMAGRCNDIYPSHSFPRGVAGAPITNDIIKCQLKPISAFDYKVTMSADDMARLKKIFAGGVCDWSKPGVDQQPLTGTWQTFNGDRGTN